MLQQLIFDKKLPLSEKNIEYLLAYSTNISNLKHEVTHEIVRMLQ